jgi:hypothetical protein
MSGPLPLTIDGSVLRVADPALISANVADPGADIVYTLTALPQHGTLTVNGVALTANGQFTQDQLDQGLVVYTDDGSPISLESFSFSISDTLLNNDLGSGTLNISRLGLSDLPGAETFAGGTSPSIFFSGPGNHSFTGGTGTTVSYALAPAAIDVDLGLQFGSNGFGGRDTFTDIHSVIGSSFNDTIWAGPGTNLIFGGGGNDTIVGDPTVADASTTTAEYSGARSDYLVVEENPTRVGIIDLRAGSPDGTDDVAWVQTFQFSDGTYTFAQLNPIDEVDRSGATDVALIGGNYFLYTHNTESGPELKYQGSPAVDGQFGFVIGAEATAGGYEVVWYNGSNDTYTAWNVDSNGNYASTLAGPINELNAAFPSLETTLQEDVNRDGVIGAPLVTTVESFGSTSLTKVGVHYYLFANGSANGPELKQFGGPVLYNIFAASVIGAEQTASGYDVAWHNTDGTYTVWSVDSNGNYVSNLVTNVAASDVGLESLEYSFHQDLNGDGIIGVPPIESFGATSLSEIGNDFFLYASGTGTGPELKYTGTPWTAGQWGGWTPIGAETTATGYEVALKIGTDTYTVWNTDANGNIIDNPIGTVTGSSLTLQALETSFQQDLNHDGIIGLPAGDTPIETSGSTGLIQTGSNYVLDKAGGGAELHYDGAAFVAGQWGGWTPIGVEATATGYEVAFKVAGADLYTVWDTDANGNIIIDPTGTVSGESPALIALEKSFQQDLNGDGMIGNPSMPIAVEAFGSTSLVLTGNDYFLDPIGTSNGPMLKYGGAAWTDGEWGGWTPIAAEITANGHEVAFNLAGTNQYTVWNTDANGNITTDTIGTVTGNSAALDGLETSFHQDLNDDGIVGDPSIPFAIETSGSTSLTQLGHDFFLYAQGTSSGPELKYAGAPWTNGVWGGWTPIGAEAFTGGYEVAFKLTGADLYTIWNTDANGNVTTNAISSVSGSDASLQSIETSFHQDLNGDGVIGPPSHTSAAVTVAASNTAGTVTVAATPYIIAPSSGNAVLAGTPASDTFVFNVQFGNDLVKSFQPGVDQVDLNHTLFASVADLLAHMADNAHGSAVLTIAADQSITIDSVSKALLQQHATDFHLS